MDQNNNPDNKNLRDQKPPDQSAETVNLESTEAAVREREARQAARLLLQSQREEKAKRVKAILKAEKEQEHAKIASGITIAVAIFASLIHSTISYAVAITVAGIAGYLMNPSKAWAGIISLVSGTIIFMLASYYYFLDRTSFLNIEIIIPLIPGAVTAWCMQKLIESVAYNDTEED